MRVLHVIPSISETQGGPSVALPLLLSALSATGVQAHVVTTDDDGVGKRMDLQNGTPVERDGVRYFFFRKQTEFYKVSRSLRSWLLRNATEYDIIHIHALFSYASTVAARVASKRGVPYIVRPLGVLNRWGLRNRRQTLKMLSLKFVELPRLRRAAALHFTSEVEKAEALSLSSDLADVRSVVIPPPIVAGLSGEPSEFTKTFPAALNREAVLFLSRLDKKKGIELLLDAFPQVLRLFPEAVLVIAGDGDRNYVTTLKRRGGELGIANHVIWTGHLQGRDKAAALAFARCFVLPSLSENFGIAAAEALAARVPTVISKEVAISGDVLEYKAGLVVERDAAYLAEAICTVLRNPLGARSMTENAQRLVRERYSPDAVGQALRQLYTDVLSQHSRSFVATQ